jgi:U3 small nucleolar RNA-associated protein 5
MRNSIHTLISSSVDLANLSGQFLAADSDRYINIFDCDKRKLLGSLVADNEIEFVSFYPGSQGSRSKQGGNMSRSNLFQRQILAAVTRGGVIEIFPKPFHQSESQSSAAANIVKSLRKTMTRRSEATVKVIRPGKSRTVIPIVSLCFQGPDLVVAVADGGVNLMFERLRWQDEDTGELILQGYKEIVKSNFASVLGSAGVNGVKDLGKFHVDESHTVVEQGGIAEGIPVEEPSQDAVLISSDDEQVSLENGESEESREVRNNEVLGPQDEDIGMEDAEPSFGDLLQANASGPIDVEAGLDNADTRTLTSGKPATSLQLPSGLSLATVLSQSLKTNDNTLLESCFHTTDTNIIRATIQRMDSSLATILLHKLADRLSSRPGRYGHLLVWVQWTCVAHGGVISGKPDILKKMSSLFEVMDQRSATLSSLLLLKGKLDMLDAQLGLRQNIRNRTRGSQSDDEEGVIYVEGQEEDDSEDEDAGLQVDSIPRARPLSGLSANKLSDGDEDIMSAALNGVASEAEREDDDASDDEEADLIDDEAEVSTGNEESGDEESEDDLEDDEDEEDGEASMADFIVNTDEESDLSVEVACRTSSSKKPTLEQGEWWGEGK